MLVEPAFDTGMELNSHLFFTLLIGVFFLNIYLMKVDGGSESLFSTADN